MTLTQKKIYPMNPRTHAILAACAVPLAGHAAITVDGTVDVDYGAPLTVQTVQTQFGDSTGGTSGGGELNAGFARIEGGRLFVTLTGNIEPNFNKVSVFIDSKVGGENTLASLGYDFNGVAANLGGMTFDTGVAIDYHLLARWGGASFEVDFVDRQGGLGVNSATGAATVGIGTPIQSGAVIGGPLAGTLDFGFNNNNAAGVTGGDQAADQAAAAAVTTGFEFAVDLADIGNPAGDIHIVAAYGNGDHNFFSNQVLGGLPAPQGNLGGDGNGNFTGNSGGINFNNFDGDQFFTITVPEPSVALLGAFGLFGLLRRRR